MCSVSRREAGVVTTTAAPGDEGDEGDGGGMEDILQVRLILNFIYENEFM